ncbi:MAG: hypothetical protein KF716_14045 [Anaerolineae bacterium]|nr:hypothetical protein [Anaerolineae bacterium]
MAAPGTYKFTHFRSQLEIRFAKELDAREIRWFYEPERLGDSRYLLDFYLPQFKAWVEVKGQVSSRDHDSLLSLSVTLLKERRQRVFMWMDKEAFAITEKGYATLTHEEFWKALTDTTSIPPAPSPSAEPNIPNLIVYPTERPPRHRRRFR